MNNYFENSICNFIPLYSYNSKKKYNVFSTCLFRMPEHYKNFDKYVNGLQKWSEYIKSSKNDYYLRIFIDQNIYDDAEIMKIIMSNKKIQPVLFTCKNYMNGKYHIDVFGANVRFFPLFNFPGNDTNRVIIVDIEPNDVDRQKIYNIVKYTNKDEVVLNAMREGLNNTIISGVRGYILAGILAFDTNKKDCKILTSFIENADKIKDKGKYEKRLTPFGFGTDEIFINKYFADYYTQFCNIINYTPVYFLKYNITFMLSKEQKTRDYLKYIMGKYYADQPIEKIIERLDLIFEKKTRNEITEYIAERFYYIINNCIKKNEEWLPMSILNIIKTYFDGLIYGFAIFTLVKHNEKYILDKVRVNEKILI
jgi:hypothetical protein